MENKSSNIISIIMIIVLVIISTILIFDVVANEGVTDYKNDNFSIYFDKNWIIKSESDTNLKLVHKSKSLFQIDLIMLEEDHIRTDLSLLIDDVLKKIEDDNPNYKLINKKENTITKNAYLGYQYLYEDNKEQVMVTIGKKNDVIFILTYAADYQCFDILLDSAKEIIWNFEII